MCDTPRTDAAAMEGWSGDALAVPVEFAQELERENAQLRQELLAYAENTGLVPKFLLDQAVERRYPHWSCKTHGEFDARRMVGCPECMREARENLRLLELAGAEVKTHPKLGRYVSIELERTK